MHLLKYSKNQSEEQTGPICRWPWSLSHGITFPSVRLLYKKWALLRWNTRGQAASTGSILQPWAPLHFWTTSTTLHFLSEAESQWWRWWATILASQQMGYFCIPGRRRGALFIQKDHRPAAIKSTFGQITWLQIMLALLVLQWGLYRLL